MADDIKKTKPSYTLEELAKAIRSAKDPDPGIRVKRGKDRSIPMPMRQTKILNTILEMV
jgi:hypothetical protein